MVLKFFLQNRRKYNIFCNFLQEFFANFRKFSGGPPIRPDPLPWTPPPKFFLRTPLTYCGWKNLWKELRRSEVIFSFFVFASLFWKSLYDLNYGRRNQNKLFNFPRLGFTQHFGGRGWQSLCITGYSKRNLLSIKWFPFKISHFW